MAEDSGKMCASCSACSISGCGETKESRIDFSRIASYLGGAISQKDDGSFQIDLGGVPSGMFIQGGSDRNFILVVVALPEKQMISSHVLRDVAQVRFYSAVVQRNETEQAEVRQVAFVNPQGGIFIMKDGDKYTLTTAIG